MRKLVGFFFFSIICVNSHILLAQESESEKREIIEERVDFLLDINEEGEVDFTTLFEQLDHFFSRPIDLNQTSVEELNTLGLLNDIQINHLLDHIKQNGKLMALEELQSINGFDLKTIKQIAPFISVNRTYDQLRWSLGEILNEGNYSYFVRYSRILEEQVGFSPIDASDLEMDPNSRYLGSPDKLYTRFRFNYSNQLSVGFTTEKDAGEEFFSGSQKDGFDFYSGHVFASGIGKIKQLALGDFQAQFGQGLTFWSGLAFGRSPSIFSLKRNAPKLRPYTSVQEDLFLRGAGTTLEFNSFNLTVFYSSQKVDANISALDTINNVEIVSSLPENGFHRTFNELEKKNAVSIEYSGAHLSYEKHGFNLGLTAVNNKLNADFQSNLRPSNHFNRLDSDNSNIGLDFNYLYKNLNLFGEISKSISGGYAYTTGALIVLDPRLSIGIQQRHFERNFIAIQSNAIGESSVNTNEKGTFLGMESQLSKKFNLSLYADRFVFPWLKFRTDAPSEGQRLFAQLSYQPSKQLELYFRYRKVEKERNVGAINEGLDQVMEESRENYRFHFNYQITKSIRISSRIELTDYKLSNNRHENGILLYQDLQYKTLNWPLSFSLRYALFDTESFDSRIYAYESDVLYAFSVPSFSGRGSRFYINSKYHLSRKIDIWLRFAQSYFTDRTFVGTANDRINGRTKSEVKVQIRVKI